MVAVSEAAQRLNPTWELASVLMEMVAFFFVTIDLYGEERLDTLNARIASFFNFILTRVRWWPKEQDRDRLAPGSTLGFLSRLALAIAGFYIYRFSTKHDFALVLNFIGLFFLVPAGLLLPFDVGHLLSRFALWLLRKLQLKGILLTVGALLFFIAKGILAIGFLEELHLPFKLPFT
jgi:hypothetical protein